MRYLFLLNSLQYGGSQTFVLTLAKELASRGHDVHIAAQPGPLLDRALRPNVTVHSVRIDAGFRWPGQSLLRYLCKFVMLYIPALVKTLLICIKGPFSCIFTQQPAPTFVAVLASLLSRTPCVYIVHGVLESEFPPLFYRQLRYKIPPIVAISREVRGYLVSRWKIQPDKIAVTTNCIDIGEYHATPRLGEELSSPTRKKRILYVGTINDGRYDAINNFISAAQLVRREINNVEFSVVGEGNMFETIAAGAVKINREMGAEVVKMHGGVSNIAPFLEKTDVFVGIGRCAREAMAMGVPTILVGTLRGRHGGNYGGIVCAEGIEMMEYYNLSGRHSSVETSPETLARDIVKILKDKPFAEGLSRFGRKYIEENCSVEKVWSSLQRCIEVEDI